MVSTKLVLGGLGAVGVPAAGYGGWALYDGVLNPIAEKSLVKQGFKKNIPAANLDATNTSSTDHKQYDCFKNFFPGTGEIGTASSTTTEWEANKHSFFSELPSSISSSAPLGCAVMHLNRESDGKFLFKSEVTVKSGNIGLVLWNKFKKDESSNDELSWENAIIFLNQKEPEKRDQWSVVGAFYQNEDIESDVDLSKLYISVGGIEWSVSSITTAKEEKYSGFWEPTGNGTGQEIFQGIKVNYDNQKWFVLGNQPPISGNTEPFNDYDFYQDNQHKTIHTWDLTEKKWITLSTEKNNTSFTTVTNSIKQNLKAFYEPFKGKKGEWKELNEDVCKRLETQRIRDSHNLEKAKNICFSKP